MKKKSDGSRPSATEASKAVAETLAHGSPVEKRVLFKDALALATFGITATDAKKQGICVSCRSIVDLATLSEEDRAEYGISALCSGCFEEIFA